MLGLAFCVEQRSNIMFCIARCSIFVSHLPVFYMLRRLAMYTMRRRGFPQWLPRTR